MWRKLLLGRCFLGNRSHLWGGGGNVWKQEPEVAGSAAPDPGPPGKPEPAAAAAKAAKVAKTKQCWNDRKLTLTSCFYSETAALLTEAEPRPGWCRLCPSHRDCIHLRTTSRDAPDPQMCSTPAPPPSRCPLPLGRKCQEERRCCGSHPSWALPPLDVHHEDGRPRPADGVHAAAARR